MAIVSAGYDGTVDETQFAKLLNRYSVVGPNDFDATNVAGDRLITISGSTAEPSQALGPGLYDSAADLGTFQFAAATGTRWDLVVLRRDWQPPGGATSIQIIQGGASKALPDREMNPGVVDDQPLYLQQINGNLLGERVDLRCWSGPGGVAAKDTLALQYLAVPGAEVRIGQTVWRYSALANNQWGWEPDYGVQVDGVPAGKRPIIKAGAAFLRNPENTANRTNAAGDGYVYFDTAFPQEMVSFNVDVANDPTKWDAPSEKFTLNMNRIYATRQRISVRVSNKDGVTVGNRDGIFVTYTAIGY